MHSKTGGERFQPILSAPHRRQRDGWNPGRWRDAAFGLERAHSFEHLVAVFVGMLISRISASGRSPSGGVSQDRQRLDARRDRRLLALRIRRDRLQQRARVFFIVNHQHAHSLK